MIKLTANTTVFGYEHATQIDIEGVTTRNCPIAEIRLNGFTYMYVIFTGEAFPSFTEAFAAHQSHMTGLAEDAEVDYSGAPLSYAESAERDIAREC